MEKSKIRCLIVGNMPPPNGIWWHYYLKISKKRCESSLFVPYGQWYWYWSKTLEEMGHQVFEFNVDFPFKRRLLLSFPFIYSFYNDVIKERNFGRIRKQFIERINKKLLSFVNGKKPDIFISGQVESLLPEAIQKIKNVCCTVIWLDNEPFVQGLENVVKSLPFYHFVFTFEPILVKKYKERGIKNCYYLPFGVYPKLHKKLKLSDEEYEKYKSSLSFIGTIFPPRVSLLKNVMDLGLSFWSINWSKDMSRLYPKLHRCYRGSVVGKDFIRVLNATQITLNNHYPLWTFIGTNMRTFEAAGCRAFQLVEEKAELKRLFKIDEEMITYSNIEDLRKKIKYYLSHPEEREEIVKRAQQRVYKEHTYKHRFEEIFHIIGL